jgi:hypothetical protein
VNWLPLESTALSSAAYFPDQRTLYLKFRSGEIYRYFEFPPEQYRDFLAADSKGQYFQFHIRNEFRCEQLPRAHGADG